MFKKLKSLFIVEGEEDKKETTQSAPQKNSATKATPKSTGTTRTTYTADAKSSSKFVDVLLKAIEANNMEGFDYLEYKQSLQNLSKMAMDEETRYKSAFAMAKTMGVTPNKLNQSAEHYLKVLSQEQSKFDDALKNQRAKQITEKEKASTQLENVIKQKEKQIEQLKSELNKHGKDLATLKKSMAGAAEKVEKTRVNFVTAYDSVVDQIKEDLEKMKQYLK